MGASTYKITSYASMRVLGLEPRTYALKGQVSPHKCLSPLHLDAVLGVRNQVSAHPLVTLRWVRTHLTIESDAQTDAGHETVLIQRAAGYNVWPVLYRESAYCVHSVADFRDIGGTTMSIVTALLVCAVGCFLNDTRRKESL